MRLKKSTGKSFMEKDNYFIFINVMATGLSYIVRWKI